MKKKAQRRDDMREALIERRLRRKERMSRYHLPSPPRSSVTVSPITDGEAEGQMMGGFIEGNAMDGRVRLVSKDPYSLAHEMGHLLDRQALTDGDRRYFQRLMRAPKGDWHQGTGPTGAGSPAEWFADYYAHVATKSDPKLGKGVSSYAQGVNPRRYRKFAAAMDRVRRRYGLDVYQEKYE